MGGGGMQLICSIVQQIKSHKGQQQQITPQGKRFNIINRRKIDN